MPSRIVAHRLTFTQSLLRYRSSALCVSLLVSGLLSSCMPVAQTAPATPTTSVPVPPVSVPPVSKFPCVGASVPVFSEPRAFPTTLEGLKVALNPGHGRIELDAQNWYLQRPEVNLNASPVVYVQEDRNNVLLAAAIQTVLQKSKVQVYPTRNLDTSAGMGLSGDTRSSEGARLHLANLKLPEGIWNSEGNPYGEGNIGPNCNWGKDLRSRALYANFLGADVDISLHSNASSSSAARGTTIFYSLNPKVVYFDHAANAGVRSKRLAEILKGTLLNAIHKVPAYSDWPEVILEEDSFLAETRYAKMPAVLIETAFHTNAQDGVALIDPLFRTALGEGLLEGLKQFSLEGQP
jgi:N-acetylmuramoyl-L-alanine amidase